MSNDEEEALMERFERWDKRHAKQAFIHRMERKLGRKERFARSG
jgi:hypothetical protein